MSITLAGPTKGSAGLLGGVAAAYNITAAVVVYSGPAVACTLACQIAGSITLNDNNATGASNTVANQIITVTMTAGQRIALNWPCATGITASAVSSGTFSLTFN